MALLEDVVVEEVHQFEPERCREHYHAAPYVCNNCAYVDQIGRAHV